MKNKTILFVSIFAVFLMMMIPNISAVEYQTVVNKNEQNLMKELKDTSLNINILRDKIKNLNNDILLSLLWAFYALCFGYFTIHNLLRGDILDAIFSFIWFIVSIIYLIDNVNNLIETP